MVDAYDLPDGIMAMAEDNGTVVTLTRRDDEHGSVYRHGGQWLPLVDPSVLNGLSFVGVTASAEPIFDKYEKNDQLVTIGHYLPSADGPTWPDPTVIYEEPEHAGEVEYDNAAEPVADESAANDMEEAPLAASIVLNSASDLDSAIAAALLNRDLRWYVERRVAALGLELKTGLPWSES